MQETVLAGQDPTKPAIDQATGKPLTIEELLRRRGMLALNNVPSMLNQSDPDAAAGDPDKDGTAANANAATSATGAALAAASGANVANAPATDGTAGGNPSKPTLAAQPKRPEEMNDNDLSTLAKVLAAGGATAAGALLLKYLANRKSNPLAPPPDLSSDPVLATPEGQRLLADNGYNARPIEDGEFYPIRDNQLTNGQKALPAPQSDSVAKALANRNGAPDPSYSVKKGGVVPGRGPVSGELQDMNTRAPKATRQQIGARQAVQSRVLPPGQGVIQSGDAMSDIPPEVRAQMDAVAQQLSARRLQGRNAVRAGQGIVRGVRNAAPPSAPINPEGIVGELARMIRANPNIAKVISRVP